MESIEALKQILKDEGFAHVYEYTDNPGKVYASHAHKGKVSFYVTEGQLSMSLKGKSILIKKGERMDVPVGVRHSAKAGPNGCAYVVGEEIEGDS